MKDLKSNPSVPYSQPLSLPRISEPKPLRHPFDLCRVWGSAVAAWSTRRGGARRGRGGEGRRVGDDECRRVEGGRAREREPVQVDVEAAERRHPGPRRQACECPSPSLRLSFLSVGALFAQPRKRFSTCFCLLDALAPSWQCPSSTHSAPPPSLTQHSEDLTG
eukprot:1014255-Rhodomonas_salina.4